MKYEPLRSKAELRTPTFSSTVSLIHRQLSLKKSREIWTIQNLKEVCAFGKYTTGPIRNIFSIRSKRRFPYEGTGFHSKVAKLTQRIQYLSGMYPCSYCQNFVWFLHEIGREMPKLHLVKMKFAGGNLITLRCSHALSWRIRRKYSCQNLWGQKLGLFKRVTT